MARHAPTATATIFRIEAAPYLKTNSLHAEVTLR
jgi:hypothetical protein